jgi:hypothetical protein
MKQTAVEWLIDQLFELRNPTLNQIEIMKQAKAMEENLQLELVHKFVFDYTYNYRGNKTLYEYVDKWHIECKRLEEIHKNK